MQMRRLDDQVLDRLNPTFCKLYPEGGRSSILPNSCSGPVAAGNLRYSIRADAIEQLDYNLLFRWLVVLNPNDPVWHPTTFIKNRDRLLNEALMTKFLELLLPVPKVMPLLSSEHFSVDFTLLMAWASYSSLERIDGMDDDPPPLPRSVPRLTSAACCSSTKSIAPQATTRPGCSGKPRASSLS